MIGGWELGERARRTARNIVGDILAYIAFAAVLGLMHYFGGLRVQ